MMRACIINTGYKDSETDMQIYINVNIINLQEK